MIHDCRVHSRDRKLGVAPSWVVFESSADETMPKRGGRYLAGKPFLIAGGWYRSKTDPSYQRVGIAPPCGRAFDGEYKKPLAVATLSKLIERIDGFEMEGAGTDAEIVKTG